MQDKIDDLRGRQQEALNAGSPRSVERHKSKGKMLARERIEYLLDEGSFQELDLLARHRAHTAGLDERPYTDGVITGWGTVDGRKIFVYAQDFTVFGGALGEVLPLVHDVAGLHDDVLAGGDEMLLFLLGLLVLDDELALAPNSSLERHDTVDTRHLSGILGPTRLKQFRNAG